MILPQGGGGVLRPTSQPIPTVHGDGIGLVEPHLCEFYGNGQPHPITEPVPTVTTRDRFALVEPVVDGYVLDIRFRMLQPHELSAAMSFPKGYKFTGNKSEQVKQIGNAWDVSMGRAICGAILDGRSRTVSIKKIEVA
jgi:DNA (cytosine-5)-methyltransferase 1